MDADELDVGLANVGCLFTADLDLEGDQGLVEQRFAHGGHEQRILALAPDKTVFHIQGHVLWGAAKYMARYLTGEAAAPELVERSAAGSGEAALLFPAAAFWAAHGAGRDVVELGAGCGLAGIVCAQLPAPPRRLVLTDYDPDVVAVLARNVAANAPAAVGATACALDWKQPAPAWAAAAFDLALATDVTYHKELCPHLFEAASRVLRPQHGALLTANGRFRYHEAVCRDSAEAVGMALAEEWLDRDTDVVLSLYVWKR
eukprot:TRINITY_DN2518_c0_g1_i1.p2 TRINITY_DN2518_c0_g1~~TRINITY_DN2518_c0_g1_i1.p2  ORF type:complete len:259 (+),score=78.29 TRINITY_DN2518_c0_g1_i1:26-802(+)